MVNKIQYAFILKPRQVNNMNINLLDLFAP